MKEERTTCPSARLVSAGYLDGSHTHSTRSAACMAYQLFVAMTATPFDILRIFWTPGIDCALLASIRPDRLALVGVRA